MLNEGNQLVKQAKIIYEEQMQRNWNKVTLHLLKVNN